MTTRTLDPQLQLALKAALLAASPAEHGRERARRVTDRLSVGLGGVAVTVGLYDLALLLGA